MRRLLRSCLLIAAFLGGCQVQNWLAIDTCLDRSGQWAESNGALLGGVCIGAPAR
jgi:hypothetical protein